MTKWFQGLYPQDFLQGRSAKIRVALEAEVGRCP